MNLDEFKYLWKAHSEEELRLNQVNREEIQRLIKGRANDALTKIKQNLVLDLSVLVAIALIGLGLTIYFQDTPIQVLVLVLCLLFLPIIILLINQYRYLSKVQLNTTNLKTNLEVIASSISNYLKSYRKRALILTFLAAPLGAGLGYYFGSQGVQIVRQEIVTAFSQSPVFWGTLGVLLLIFIGNFFFTRWYLNVLYGKYLVDIQNCLEELAVK